MYCQTSYKMEQVSCNWQTLSLAQLRVEHEYFIYAGKTYFVSLILIFRQQYEDKDIEDFY